MPTRRNGSWISSGTGAVASRGRNWKFAAPASFAGPGGDFELRGVADRIDLLSGGGAAILDYKSGKPPTNAQVKELLTPQLPLEAAILAEGGFPGLGKQPTEELLYLHISGPAQQGAIHS